MTLQRWRWDYHPGKGSTMLPDPNGPWIKHRDLIAAQLDAPHDDPCDCTDCRAWADKYLGRATGTLEHIVTCTSNGFFKTLDCDCHQFTGPCYHTKHEGSPPCLHDAYVAGIVTGHRQILRDCDNHYLSGYRNGLAAAREAVDALTVYDLTYTVNFGKGPEERTLDDHCYECGSEAQGAVVALEAAVAVIETLIGGSSE